MREKGHLGEASQAPPARLPEACIGRALDAKPHSSNCIPVWEALLFHFCGRMEESKCLISIYWHCFFTFQSTCRRLKSNLLCGGGKGIMVFLALEKPSIREVICLATIWGLPHQGGGFKNENMVQRKKKSWRVGTGGMRGMYNKSTGKSEQSPETSPRRRKCTQAMEQMSLLFPLNSNLQETNHWVFVFFGLCFCFAFMLQKGPGKFSGSGEIFMSVGKTKPRLSTRAGLP